MDRFNKSIQVRPQANYHREQFDLYARTVAGEDHRIATSKSTLRQQEGLGSPPERGEPAQRDGGGGAEAVAAAVEAAAAGVTASAVGRVGRLRPDGAAGGEDRPGQASSGPTAKFLSSCRGLSAGPACNPSPSC